jgi:hypothetical protein
VFDFLHDLEVGLHLTWLSGWLEVKTKAMMEAGALIQLEALLHEVGFPVVLRPLFLGEVLWVKGSLTRIAEL